MDLAFHQRVALFGALGDPARLGIIDDLTVSDRSPTELGARHGLSSNLLAHHLDILESVGLISRGVSAGDARRRYVRLNSALLLMVAVAPRLVAVADNAPPPEMIFVCTHNSARSQLAAALWTQRSGARARSAGTHPAPEVHRMALEAGRRRGLDLTTSKPQLLDLEALGKSGDHTATQIVTVCDRVHEDLDLDPSWWHWSVADPVEVGTDAAFDAVIAELDIRIDALLSFRDRTREIEPDRSNPRDRTRTHDEE